MRVLITRPEPDDERTAAALRQRGFDPLMLRLMRVEARDPGPVPVADRLIATSGHALAHLPQHWRQRTFLRLPIHVVGARTAEAARKAGFIEVHEGPGDAQGLVAGLLSAAQRGEHLAYLAGEPRKALIEDALPRHGFLLGTHVLYQATPLDTAPEMLVQALNVPEPLAVLHFSRASAEAFVKLTTTLPKNGRLLHVCLSSDVAQAVDGAVVIADAPNEARLILALETAVATGWP